jgi:hypothetical protein
MRLLASFLLIIPLIASTRAPQDPRLEMEVHETVVHFLELLGELRFYALGQYMTEDANVITARWSKSGYVNRVQSGEEWLAGMMEGPGPQPFREELTNVEIEVASGELAQVRAEFEIVRDTGVASFGVDFFTLVRQDDQWKLASVAFTSIPARERGEN